MSLIERAARAIAGQCASYRYDQLSEQARKRLESAVLLVVAEIMTATPDPSEAERALLQSLCDELDRQGYRPTGWIDPPVLR